MHKYSLPLDHVVMVVPSLDAAISHFRAKGFTVSAGGRNGPTQNALIPFQDGTYIELINAESRISKIVFRFLYQSRFLHLLKPLISPLSFRFLYWLGGPPGIRDWCLRVSKLGQFSELLQAGNIELSEIRKFARIKPDREVAEWQLLAPVDQSLPFFIDDITYIGVRVPDGRAAIHENGIVGISRVLLNNHASAQALAKIAACCLRNLNEHARPNNVELSFDSNKHGQIAVELITRDGNLWRLETP